MYENRKDEVNRLYNKKTKYTQKLIYDNKAHQEIKDTVNKNISDFAATDFKYPKSSKERNHLVSLRKEGKNKFEFIKVTKLIEILQSKRINEHKMK